MDGRTHATSGRQQLAYVLPPLTNDAYYVSADVQLAYNAEKATAVYHSWSTVTPRPETPLGIKGFALTVSMHFAYMQTYERAKLDEMHGLQTQTQHLKSSLAVDPRSSRPRL